MQKVIPHYDVQDTVDSVLANPKIFRPGTKIPPKTSNFVLQQGGLGDYIAYLAPFKWIADNHPQVSGRIYCEPWVIPLAENVLKPYFPQWKVYPREQLTKKKMRRPTLMPSILPISRVGCHSLDLGYIYYLGMSPPPPDGNFYPRFDLSEVRDVELPESKGYVVMTPCSSNKPKIWKPKGFNVVKDYIIKRGYTPVFLGNQKFSEKRNILLQDGYDFEGGVNLLGQTTILEAAKVMSKAKAVVGLDNGLLHLAATTSVPIVYGYTISSVEHTRPRRPEGCGEIYDIHPDQETLACTFCQSRMRMFFSHDFAECLYGDELCTDALNVPAPWVRCLEEILNGDS